MRRAHTHNNNNITFESIYSGFQPGLQNINLPSVLNLRSTTKIQLHKLRKKKYEFKELDLTIL